RRDAERAKSDREQAWQQLLPTGELAAERDWNITSVVNDDFEQPEKRRVPILEVFVHVRVISSGCESVLREIVRTDREKIDMPCNRRNRQRGGGRLDHCAERRAALHAKGYAGLVEEFARRPNVLFERDHRYEHANVLRARQTDEHGELSPQQC